MLLKIICYIFFSLIYTLVTCWIEIETGKINFMEIFASLVPSSFQLMEGMHLPKFHRWNTYALLT